MSDPTFEAWKRGEKRIHREGFRAGKHPIDPAKDIFDLEYARHADGSIMQRLVLVPFRPEFLRFFTSKGEDAPKMPWAGPEFPNFPEEPGAKNVRAVTALCRGPELESSGRLRDDADEPAALESHLFAIDLRACDRYGFNFIDVSHVELPVLDYAKPDPLEMRVYVRVRPGEEKEYEASIVVPPEAPTPAVPGPDDARVLMLIEANGITTEEAWRIVRAEEKKRAEEAFAGHADTCPLGCGIDYTPGRCVEGDALAEKMDGKKKRAPSRACVDCGRDMSRMVSSSSAVIICETCANRAGARPSSS